MTDAMLRDVAAELAVWLQPRLDARTENYVAGALARNQHPAGGTGSPDSLPYVLISSVNVGGEWPHTQEDDLRITAWHRNRDDAVDLARLTHAIIRNTAGCPLEQITEITGVVYTHDQPSGTDVAGFTIVAALTPGTFTP